jgi:hypothetical protein
MVTEIFNLYLRGFYPSGSIAFEVIFYDFNAFCSTLYYKDLTYSGVNGVLFNDFFSEDEISQLQLHWDERFWESMNPVEQIKASPQNPQQLRLALNRYYELVVDNLIVKKIQWTQIPLIESLGEILGALKVADQMGCKVLLTISNSYN